MNRRTWTAIPNERLNEHAVHQLPGHLPTRVSGRLRGDRAHDPYFETLNDIVQPPGATSIEHARAIAGRGGVRLPAEYRRPAPKWPDALLRPSQLNTMLNLLGALISYRVLTNNQAAAIAGDPSLADPRCDLIAELFRCGVIDLASPYIGHSLGVAGGGTTAYQVGKVERVLELQRHLTWAEWLAVTGNRALPTEPINLRHDILAAELGLRAAEYLRVGTVLGPHFSRFSDFVDPAKRGGPDLTIVRDDGLRIAVEITASLGENFSKKVEHWAKRLGDNWFDQSSPVVIFLVAPSPAMLEKNGDRVRRATYRLIEQALDRHPGSVRAPVAARIGVATWREWFPSPLTASCAFAQLTVDRLDRAEKVWEPCDMWDPADLPFEPTDPDAARAVIPNTALLSQTPEWIRWRHEPAKQIASLLRAAGEPLEVAPLRDRSGVRRPGAAQGVADDTFFPARLLGPTDYRERATRQPIIARHDRNDPAALTPPVFGHWFAQAEGDFKDGTQHLIGLLGQ